MITTLIRPMIFPMIRSSIKSAIESICNAYIFSDTNSDSLSLTTPFTGNVKAVIAAPSETGIDPTLAAGRTTAFAPSPDPLNNPQWMFYEADVTNLTDVVDEIFNGRVGYIYIDDVEYPIDMGAPATRFAPKFDGVTTYMQLDSPVVITETNTLTLEVQGITESNPTRGLANFSGAKDENSLSGGDIVAGVIPAGASFTTEELGNDYDAPVQVRFTGAGTVSYSKVVDQGGV